MRLAGMARILVTGGAGFIGANFVHRTVHHQPGPEATVLDALTYAGNEASLAGVAGQITFQAVRVGRERPGVDPRGGPQTRPSISSSRPAGSARPA